MNTWKHISKDNRKVISSGIANEYKLIQISKILNYDPTSISKEVKRNRITIEKGYLKEQCPKLKRWPYVCSNCYKRYQHCGYDKYKYDAKKADEKAQFNLINSRIGIDMSEEEFSILDNLITDGMNENKSLYQIKMENKEQITKSIPTLYRYINSGKLTKKRYNLPYACSYKKRKHNKKYEYSENNFIDRTNHTYLDYLAYIHANPNVNVWQLDFLGHIKSDSKSILTLININLHTTLLDIIQNVDAHKVVELFDKIELLTGTNSFIELFDVILTDRDPNFADIEGITISKLTGEIRCHLFFCDPYVSNQKPQVENMNHQLRKYFPKGKSIDNFARDKVKEINYQLNSIPLKIMDGYSPKEAFIKIYGEDLYNNLFK